MVKDGALGHPLPLATDHAALAPCPVVQVL